jgi:hypothetical protein
MDRMRIWPEIQAEILKNVSDFALDDSSKLKYYMSAEGLNKNV